jgi:hypothetical protein
MNALSCGSSFDLVLWLLFGDSFPNCSSNVVSSGPEVPSVAFHALVPPDQQRGDARYCDPLVSHPLASIEALSRLPRFDIDEILPQQFAAANHTILHHAMMHWASVNSLLDMFADTRIRIEDLGGANMTGIASLLLNIGQVERQRIVTSLPRQALTWKDLRDEDIDLAALVFRTWARYGYDCMGL